jgi:Lrp/AsnC family transcriptional regulator
MPERGVHLDAMDLKILDILQRDASLAVADIARAVGLSTTPCWRRIRRLEEIGVIRRRVALLDGRKIGAGLTVFVSIKTGAHTHAGLEAFHAAVLAFPEVVSFYRMTGEVDYILRVLVPSIEAYDGFYKQLISRIDAVEVSSAFAMEELRNETALPLHYARAGLAGDVDKA